MRTSNCERKIEDTESATSEAKVRRKAQCGFERRLHTLPCDEEVVAHVRPTGELNPATSGMIGGGIPILGHISSIQAAVGIEDAEHP